MIIYAIVDASAQDEALAAGRAVFDRLVGTTPYGRTVFDYYVTFDTDETAVAGQARWGKRPVAAPVGSQDGAAMLEQGWEATKTEFERNLDCVKEALETLSDDEIMRGVDLSRHAFYRVGAYDGPSIFLYDEYANGIRHRDQLDRVLDEGENLWIVPADVHF